MADPHFNGYRFFNKDVPPRPFWHILYWFLTRRPVKWPATIPVEQTKIEKKRVAEDELIVTFINHSTVLIQLSGWNILTDPIWSERASPFVRWGPKRHALPGVRFEDLPPIDLVLVSHNHYDHMDLPTLNLLQSIHQPTFFVSKGNRHYLEKRGFKNVKELDWGEKFDFSINYQIIFVPGQHFSARGLFDRDQTLWGGFVIRGSKHLIYFAADTGYGPHFKNIRQTFGSPTLSFLPIGAFKPDWFMKPIHLSPSDAVQAHLDLESKQSIAIHFGTFQMADEGYDEPIKELKVAMERNGIDDEQFMILKNGESLTFS